MDAAILKAQERAAIVAGDKEALREIHLREMGLSDWTNRVSHARREGMQEGIQKGIREGQKELIALIKSGKTVEEAEKLLGL